MQLVLAAEAARGSGVAATSTAAAASAGPVRAARPPWREGGPQRGESSRATGAAAVAAARPELQLERQQVTP